MTQILLTRQIMQMIEHHIQKDIIEKLARAKCVRFSDLKPQDLESNAFMYHLKQLMSEGLVDKTDDGYSLSDQGLTFIDGFSFHTHKLRKQPKVISILAIRNNQDKWLLARRKNQPYIGKYMLPSGKQHFGESPEDHAKRELKEKMSLELPLRRRGLSDIRIYHEQQIITHVTAHVYEAVTDMKATPEQTEQFEYSWQNPNDLGGLLLAGSLELLNKLTTEKGLFFLSLDVQDD